MKLEVIVLAAGQGTRMRSELPKVLHPLARRPLLAHVLDTVRALEPRKIHIVVGHGAERVREALDAPDINWVLQAEQLGTGHAVLQAIPDVDRSSTVLVLYGDVPLLRELTLKQLVDNAPALLTARFDDPSGYGRVLRSDDDQLCGVVEHKDASEEELAIQEVNTGVLAYPAALLAEYLPRVGNANVQREYYLPDVLAMAVEDGHCVAAMRTGDADEVLGINDRAQLAAAEAIVRCRAAVELMAAGVSLADPTRIDVRGRLRCGRDVFIDVNCVFEGDVVLGDGVHVGPNCVLRESRVGDDCRIEAMSHLENAEVGGGCSVGPFARLRPGTRLGDGARIGNFVETKKADIGPGSKVNHLSYVGDAQLGAGVNVGAGTITCNYDGVAKHLTTLGNDVFVGSNSTLVAPLTVGDGAFVAAGSTLTQDLPPGTLGVGRSKQRSIDGWKSPKRRAAADQED
ncbi:MAG: bifunctional UDP-N-acetylglucosamine diphosphorylase/glucosamine-1-phosphate N-acetyltransferase GlmU [Halieaceae bacterium]|nr:bifunctional UDP-N-acetylglucosamine diphosphorylase/glucosamine-1-phosphate N-acetyltransferase GlmU [Halieaceae bacterium]